MKYTYTKAFSFIFFLLSFNAKSSAQCPMGYPPGSTAFDTTIAFPTGTTSIPVKFPQFDPVNGMVTCVRLCVTITGIIDTLAMQNYAASSQTATFVYTRNDQITGPGIGTPLSNSANLTYGPPGNILTAYDGIPGAGTDFYSMANDTILNEELCRTISDSATIVQFYGHDSVTYNYDINVSTNATITGGSSSTLVLTSALVNFHFEYCTCPIVTLPLSIRNFFVTKISDNTAELKWSAFDDLETNYRYEVELSKDGRNFFNIGQIAKNMSENSNVYKFIYTASPSYTGVHFFRIRQVYTNGYSRFSDIRTIDLKNSLYTGFHVYPNPSTGIIGIKFDNNESGKKLVEVYNTQGQKVMQKELVVTGLSYHQLGTLQQGTYWLRLTDVTSKLSRVNQLFIK